LCDIMIQQFVYFKRQIGLFLPFLLADELPCAMIFHDAF